MNYYLDLFLTFFKIGAFTIGGGYAMLPLIQAEAQAHGWMSEADLVNFVAVSESTPGPLAVNFSTYIGRVTGGFFGALCATAGVVLPSFIIILAIAGCYKKVSIQPDCQRMYVRSAPCRHRTDRHLCPVCRADRVLSRRLSAGEPGQLLPDCIPWNLPSDAGADFSKKKPSHLHHLPQRHYRNRSRVSADLDGMTLQVTLLFLQFFSYASHLLRRGCSEMSLQFSEPDQGR